MNINYLKGPGAQPGTWLVYLLAEMSIRGHALMCAQGRVGLGREGTGPCESPAPSPGGEAHISGDSQKPSGSGQAHHPGQLAARCSSVPQNGPHSALRLGAGLGVFCQSALPCDHKPMVSWKESWTLEAKEPRAWSSCVVDMLCDLGSSPHLSGPWGISSGT